MGFLTSFYIFLCPKQANQAKRDAYWRAMRVKIFIAVIILVFILCAVFIL